MATDYERGAAIVRLIRSGESDWIERVLRVRGGEIVRPRFVEARLNGISEECITDDQARRALDWADAIWVSEESRIDEDLVEIVEERDRLIKEVEEKFRDRLSKIITDPLTNQVIDAILRSHPERVLESRHRRDALSTLWGEINRERLLSQIAQSGRPKGLDPSFSNSNDEYKKAMYIIAAWVEKEERRRRDDWS